MFTGRFMCYVGGGGCIPRWFYVTASTERRTPVAWVYENVEVSLNRRLLQSDERGTSARTRLAMVSTHAIHTTQNVSMLFCSYFF